MKRTIYEYQCKIYLNADDLNAHLNETLGSNYNNIDFEDTAEYEQTWEYDVEELDLDDWNTFKEWCIQEKLNPSHARSVERYYRGYHE